MKHTIDDLSSPAAITGSFISSLVIGHRNSSGMPRHTESLFSSSTFLRSLLRRPTDSTDTHQPEQRHIKTRHAVIQRKKEKRKIAEHQVEQAELTQTLTIISIRWSLWAFVIRVFSTLRSRVTNVSVGEGGGTRPCLLSVQFKDKCSAATRGPILLWKKINHHAEIIVYK